MSEKVNPQEKSLTKREQINFQSMMSLLIFGKQPEPGEKFTLPPLTKKTVPTISNIILGRYLKILMHSYDILIENKKSNEATEERLKEFNSHVNSFKKDLLDTIGQMRPPTKEYLYEVFEALENYLSLVNSEGFSYFYNEPDFCPAFSAESPAFNCFAFTQIIGKCLQQAGFKVGMALSSNHPMCYLEIEDRIYFVSNYGIYSLPNSILNIPENKKDFYLFIPEHDQLILTGFDISERRFAIVQDFDTGVVYEYLENLAAYKAISEGQEVNSVESNKDSDYQTVLKLNSGLGTCDWSKIQAKIFPEIREIFDTNAQSFELEYEKMKTQYKEQWKVKVTSEFLQAFFRPIFLNSRTSNVEEKWAPFFKNKLKEYSELIVEYTVDIIKYLEENVPFRENVPVEVQDFVLSAVQYVQTHVEPDNMSEVLEYIFKKIYLDTDE